MPLSTHRRLSSLLSTQLGLDSSPKARSLDFIFAGLDVNKIPDIGEAPLHASPVGAYLTKTRFNNTPSAIPRSRVHPNPALQQLDMDMQMRHDFDDVGGVGGIMLPRGALNGLWTIPGLLTFGSQEIQHKAFMPCIDLKATPAWAKLDFDFDGCHMRPLEVKVIDPILEESGEAYGPLSPSGKLEIEASIAVNGEDSDAETAVSSSRDDGINGSACALQTIDQILEADNRRNDESAVLSSCALIVSNSSMESYGWGMDMNDQRPMRYQQLRTQTISSKEGTSHIQKLRRSVRGRSRKVHCNINGSTADLDVTSGSSTIKPRKPHRESVKNNSMCKHTSSAGSSANHKTRAKACYY